MEEKYSDVRFVTLPDMHVAIYNAKGYSPEDDAIEYMHNWFENKGIKKDDNTRAFGFDAPVSSEEEVKGIRSYELMVTVPNNVDASDEVTTKNIKSDQYAVMRIKDPFEDPLKSIPFGWQILKNWIRTTEFQPSNFNERYFFEEIITQDDKTFIDLYHPINKEKNKQEHIPDKRKTNDGRKPQVNMQRGNMQRGNTQQGNMQQGNIQHSNMQPNQYGGIQNNNRVAQRHNYQPNQQMGIMNNNPYNIQQNIQNSNYPTNYPQKHQRYNPNNYQGIQGHHPIGIQNNQQGGMYNQHLGGMQGNPQGGMYSHYVGEGRHYTQPAQPRKNYRGFSVENLRRFFMNNNRNKNR